MLIVGLSFVAFTVLEVLLYVFVRNLDHKGMMNFIKYFSSALLKYIIVCVAHHINVA
jgi:hypothetical protein